MAKKSKKKAGCPICGRRQATYQWCAGCKSIGRAVTLALAGPPPADEAAAREAIHHSRAANVPRELGRD